MATGDLSRHQIIKILIAHLPEKDVDAAIRVWEQMATQIISIVGEDGFNSLYARSLFLSQAKCPWLYQLADAKHRPPIPRTQNELRRTNTCASQRSKQSAADYIH